MRYLDALPPMIEDAYAELFKNAEALGDKLNYKASDTTRTPLELVQECATMPGMLAQTIRDRKMSDATSGAMEDAPQPEPPATLDACRAAYEAGKGELFDAIRAFPDDQLEVPFETPWGTFAWRDFIAYSYWNPYYHTGQLAYVQTIHGDTEMH